MRCNNTVILFAILATLLACASAEEKRGPKITSKVYFDIEIDGKDAGGCFSNSKIPIHHR
jgi:hypothetical protein